MSTIDAYAAKAEHYSQLSRTATSPDERARWHRLHRSYALLAKNAAFWSSSSMKAAGVGEDQLAPAVTRPRKK
jgi:hypothetical protein